MQKVVTTSEVPHTQFANGTVHMPVEMQRRALQTRDTEDNGGTTRAAG